MLFRSGHHYASELVNYGRGNGLKPSEIPYMEAQRIYIRVAEEMKLNSSELPLSEARFREALSAENMVNSSKGLGGPQVAEVRRMQTAAETQLTGDKAWLHTTRSALSSASNALATAFSALR